MVGGTFYFTFITGSHCLYTPICSLKNLVYSLSCLFASFKSMMPTIITPIVREHRQPVAAHVCREFEDKGYHIAKLIKVSVLMIPILIVVIPC